MEPSGRNRWQSVANSQPAEAANKPNPLPPAASGIHGKEAVDGSSPSEGSAKSRKSGLASQIGLHAPTTCMRYGADDGAFRDLEATS